MKKTAICLLVFLAACGGGGGDSSSSTLVAAGPTATPIATASPTSTPASSPSAVGLWKGQSTNKTTNAKRSITGLVLPDGRFYVMYSSSSDLNSLAGVVVGQGSVSGNVLNWTNAKDFNLEGLGAILDATITGTAVSKTSLNGDTSYTNSANNSTFTGTYSKDFETIPSLSTVAGAYSGKVSTAAGTELANVTISNTGDITGSGQQSGCAISGSLKPRSDANAYDVSVKFGPAPCLLANQTLSGISYFDANAKRLYAIAPNTARTDGVLFVGTKP
jgi:hypothetical protein